MNVLKHNVLPRRSFLRGCGATLALPFLDVMQAKAEKGSTAPRRLAFFYTPTA